MDTIDDTQEMPSLDQRVINYFDEACRALGDTVSPAVIKDISFFVRSPDMQPTCSTNTRIAYQVGKLAARASGIDALYVEIIWLCVMAKDMWQKGTLLSAIVDCANKAELLLDAAREWQKGNLSF